MAKYEQKGTTISLDLEDGKPTLVADLSRFNESVQREIGMFGLRTLMRNATAGKIEDLSDGKARSAVEQRLATFASGKFVAEGSTSTKTDLSDEERTAVIRDVVVMAKKAKGDTRPPAEIAQAFNALPDEQKSSILATLQKVIDKQLKAKLREKRTVGKAAEKGGAMEF